MNTRLYNPQIVDFYVGKGILHTHHITHNNHNHASSWNGGEKNEVRLNRMSCQQSSIEKQVYLNNHHT